MPSRRALLRAGGLGLAAALGGCLSGGEPADAGDQTPTTTANPTTTQYTADPDPVRRLQLVDPPAVPDGGGIVPVNEPVLELVSEAASTDGRVDFFPADGRPDEDDPLVFAAFDRVEFRGETYEPSSSFAGFAQEATFILEAVRAAESEIGSDDVLDYGSLTESEREIADQLVAEGRYTAGGHAEVPEAFFTLRSAEFLRTDDAVYRLQTGVADNAPHHMLTLTSADADSDATVVTVEDRVLPAALREPVRAAVEQDAAELSDDEAERFREVLGAARFVCTAHAVVEVLVDGEQ